MSKVVQGIGDAIGDVVKGAISVVKNVADGVGDLARGIANSPIGKAILIAGAIYFGGAALAGGFGQAAGGGSFLSGMGTGVASAAETLSSAWSSTLAGNFGEAASGIGNSFGTAYTAGGNSAAMTSALQSGAGSLSSSGAAIPGASSSNVAALGPNTSQVAAATPGASAGTGLTAGGSTSQGLITNGMSAAGDVGLGSSVNPYALVQPGAASASALPAAGTLPGVAPAAAPSWWASLDPSLKAATIMTGAQVGGSLVAGMGAASAAEDERKYNDEKAAEIRARAEEGRGTIQDFSELRRIAAATPYTGSGWNPSAAADKIISDYYIRTAANKQPVGIVNKYMSPSQG
ncbi:hypothetical protein UFOVP474_39 [uncultured Caudovirales phage]|uniref:Uncharacterized protein n=1 Tax=uncultured Caudovirales phage TaxID=2100421 RepID=A0A6J5MHZ9_9CAUD|nr:hypothetical protein UFOVP474_39 [uncultured Caudovirales phage]CAB4189935.1 hypothetical protein UFOVP1207_35 [uncultured Caudovirales phage]